jgi:hypothetical protein
VVEHWSQKLCEVKKRKMLFRQAELNPLYSSSESDDLMLDKGDTNQIIIPRASVPLPATPRDSSLDSQLECVKQASPCAVVEQKQPPDVIFPHSQSFLAASVMAASQNSGSFGMTLHAKQHQHDVVASHPSRITSLSLSTPVVVSSLVVDPFDSVSSTRPVPVYAQIELPLKDILFYQDYISQRFMDGRLLTDTIAALQQGNATPHTLPRMQCLKYRGRWYGMGNRRLACYHYVFRDTPNKMIPVDALELPDDEGFNALGDGKQVRVGGGLRIVEFPGKAALEQLSPAEQKMNCEVAELRAVVVYNICHCSS